MIENYPHRLGGHCGSGALRDLLHWAGLGWAGPPGEGLVFGLGGDLSFTYVRFRTPAPLVYFVGRGPGMELQLCRRLGIETERRQTDDPGKGLRWVTEELDAGRPVMIWADIAELPYLRVRLTNTRHDIVVIGYDEHCHDVARLTGESAFAAAGDAYDECAAAWVALAAAGRESTDLDAVVRAAAKLPDLENAAATSLAAVL